MVLLPPFMAALWFTPPFMAALWFTPPSMAALLSGLPVLLDEIALQRRAAAPRRADRR